MVLCNNSNKLNNNATTHNAATQQQICTENDALLSAAIPITKFALLVICHLRAVQRSRTHCNKQANSKQCRQPAVAPSLASTVGLPARPSSPRESAVRFVDEEIFLEKEIK